MYQVDAEPGQRREQQHHHRQLPPIYCRINSRDYLRNQQQDEGSLSENTCRSQHSKNDENAVQNSSSSRAAQRGGYFRDKQQGLLKESTAGIHICISTSMGDSALSRRFVLSHTDQQQGLLKEFTPRILQSSTYLRNIRGAAEVRAPESILCINSRDYTRNQQ